MVKRRKDEDIDTDLIKKAARLLKDEKLTDEQRQAYSLHAKKLHTYKRLKIYVQKRNEQWSIDLADLNRLVGYNKQYRYILVCVDVYTRYAFVKPQIMFVINLNKSLPKLVRRQKPFMLMRVQNFHK